MSGLRQDISGKKHCLVSLLSDRIDSKVIYTTTRKRISDLFIVIHRLRGYDRVVSDQGDSMQKQIDFDIRKKGRKK